MREDVPLAVPRLTAAGAPGPPRAGWIVEEPRWDAYNAVVFAACMAIVQAGPLDPTARIIATVGLTAMVPWYIFLGRPLMNLDDAIWRSGGAGRDAAIRRGTVYLAGLVVMFTVAQSQDSNTWFLAFALCPQCFHVTTPRRGMVFVVIINVIAGGLEAWHNPGLPGALTALGIVVFAITFSYVYSRWIVASSPGARVLILTTYETDADILRAVEAGAAGYLLKDATPAELAGAVRAAARGETVLAPSVAERLVTHVRRPRESLSARETEVLALVARGRTNAEIGRALFISEATVKTHLLRAFGKLGVSGRTAAVTTAIERGLLPPPGQGQDRRR